MITILTRVLEVLIGLLAIVNFRWQSKNKGKMSEQDWIYEVKKQEREIGRLKEELSLWKKRHQEATNETT